MDNGNNIKLNTTQYNTSALKEGIFAKQVNTGLEYKIRSKITRREF